MKTVILVYPKTGIDPKKPMPPYSILSLGYFLEKKGYKAVIVDDRVEDAEKKIKENLKDAIGVGISSMTGFQIYHALKLAQIVRDQNPRMPIVWGGVHATFLPKQTIKNNLVDVIVKGEGELILPEVIKCLDLKKSLNNIPNIIYKHKGKIIETKTQSEIVDLNEFPCIPPNLINVQAYIRPDFGVERTIALVTSRGCPHRCGFCYNLNFNKGKWRSKNAKQIVEDIKQLKDKYNIEGIDFSEDNFFANKKRVLEICKMLIEKKIDIAWASSCRVDYFSRYTLEETMILKQSGLKQLAFGIESGSERILILIHKDITLDQIYKASEICEKSGITPRFSFMSGFPTETEEDLNKTLDLIDKLKDCNKNSVIAGVLNYAIFPGTPLYNLSVKEGFKAPKSLEDWAGYSFVNSSERLDWLSKKYKRRLKVIALISRLIFYDKKVEATMKKRSQIFAFNILRLFGKARWKYRFFSFPLEWLVVNWYYDRMSKGIKEE